jgi:hypothetical protein
MKGGMQKEVKEAGPHRIGFNFKNYFLKPDQRILSKNASPTT